MKNPRKLPLIRAVKGEFALRKLIEDIFEMLQLSIVARQPVGFEGYAINEHEPTPNTHG